jgi:hypothetical protein
MLFLEVLDTMATSEMQPLSQILQTIEERYGLVLHRTNLAAKTLASSDGDRESILDRLAQHGLAEAVTHGQRRLWYLAPEAIPRLIALAQGARPGPAPGAQVTLDAGQLRELVRHLAAADDPVEALRGALTAATGWDDEAIARVERIVIPLAPRRRLGSGWPSSQHTP